MSTNLQRYVKAIHLLDAVAQRVPADAWDNPSCCDGWSAREVGGHAAWLMKNLSSLANDNGTIPEQAEAEVLGDDPAAGMRAVVGATVAALDQKGVLAKVIKSPFGEMPIDQFIGFVWSDPVTHAWDVADATGIDHGIDAATATEALEQMRPASDALRGPGRFGDIAEPAGDDPVSAFIAFTGRTPVQ